MATETLTFTADAARITLTGRTGSDGVDEYTTRTDHPDPVVRTIAQEFATNATTSGTVTITAV